MRKHLIYSLVLVMLLGIPQLALLQDPSPLPAELESITAATAADVRQIGQIGQGKVVETGWSPDGSQFVVVTTAGVAFYDPADFNHAPTFVAGYTRLSRFNADWSKWVMTATDLTTQLWDRASMTAINLTNETRYTISPRTNFAFTPDGKLLVMSAQTEEYDRVAVIWDVENEKLYGQWFPLDGQFSNDGVHMSPAGHWLSSQASGQSTVMTTVLDINQVEQSVMLSRARAYTFSYDDRFLAWASWNDNNLQDVYLRDLTAEGEDFILPLDSASPVQLLFSPDDRTLAVIAKDQQGKGMLVLLDVERRERLATSTFDIGNDLPKLTFSPDGRYLIGKNYYLYTNMWDAQTAAPITTPWALPERYSPDGQYILTNNQLWLADFTQTEEALFTLKGSFSSFSPDSHWLVTLYGTTLYLHDLNQPTFATETSIALADFATYDGAAYTPDGTMLLINNQLLDSETFEPLATITGFQGEPSFGIDREGQLWLAGAYVTGSQNPEPAVWLITIADQTVTVSEPRVLKTTLTTYYWPGTVVLSPNAGYAAGAYGDEFEPAPAVQIWNLTRNTRPIAVYGHQEKINNLAFSPDSALLATASGYTTEYGSSKDNTVRLWRIQRDTTTSLTEITRFYPDGEASRVRFSPDGRWIAAAIFGGKITIWDTVTGKSLASMDNNVDLMAFSPDGTVFATSDWYGKIRLYNTRNWHEIVTLDGHTTYLHSLEFTPDGRVLASSSGDETVRFWGIAP